MKRKLYLPHPYYTTVSRICPAIIMRLHGFDCPVSYDEERSFPLDAMIAGNSFPIRTDDGGRFAEIDSEAFCLGDNGHPEQHYNVWLEDFTIVSTDIADFPDDPDSQPITRYAVTPTKEFKRNPQWYADRNYKEVV